MDEKDEKVVFRSSKRRKVLRARGTDDGEDNGTEHRLDCSRESDLSNREDTGTSKIPTHVRAPPLRKSGIAFSSDTKPTRATPKDQTTSTALVHSTPTSHATALVNNRFIAPTGEKVVTEDKHMSSWIDSRLARPVAPPSSLPPLPTSTTDRTEPRASPPPPKHLPLPSAPTQSNPPPRPARTPRPPRRRNQHLDPARSARDQLVEQLLSTTHRVDSPYSTAPNTGTSDDGARRGHNPAADARMAAEFEREFRLGAEERRARGLAASASASAPGGGGGTGAGKKDSASSSASASLIVGGPKMGGSKNRRLPR